MVFDKFNIYITDMNCMSFQKKYLYYFVAEK